MSNEEEPKPLKKHKVACLVGILVSYFSFSAVIVWIVLFKW